MEMDDFVLLLDAARRCSRGYTARCPAHRDKTPSLSVSNGDRGILVKCWAACTLNEVVAALGLTVADLFYDDRHQDPHEVRRAWRRREAKRQEREAVQRRDGLRIDAVREAETLIRCASGLDISTWSDSRLAGALNRLADAYEVSEHEGESYGT